MPGDAVGIAGGGFAPNQPLDIILFSDPLPLGSTRSDAAGRFETTATIPLAAVPGPHQIVVSGVGPFGGGHRSVAALTVEDLARRDQPAGASRTSGTLPRTGPPEAGLPAEVGLIAIGLGIVLIGLARNRARTTSI
jgi:hypothetical protein